MTETENPTANSAAEAQSNPPVANASAPAPTEGEASTPGSRAMILGAVIVAAIGIVGLPLLVMFGLTPNGTGGGSPVGPIDPTKSRAGASYQPSIERGESVYRRVCASCHTIDGRRYTGPTFKGLYMSEVPLRSGETVVADEAYLRESILDPNAAITAGYQPVMLSYANSLQAEEIEDVIAYIKTIK